MRHSFVKKLLSFRLFQHTLFNLRDVNLSAAIGAVFFGLYLTNLADGLSAPDSIFPSIISVLCKLLIFTTLFFCIKVILKRLNKAILAMIIPVLVVPILQFVLFPSTKSFFLNTYLTFVLTIFPAVICVSVLKDYTTCFRVLMLSSLLISLLNFLVLVLCGGDAFHGRYNMGYANSLILPTNLMLWCAFSVSDRWKERIPLLILVFCNILGVFVYGSRGALAAIGLFCVFLFFRIPFPTPRSKKIKLFIVLACIPLLIFYRPILSLVNVILEKVGFYSRTLDLLISDAGHDSGRSVLWSTVWSDFSTNPFSIRGINSDYAVIGIFSHNIFLELLHAFGVLLGVPLCVALVLCILCTLMLTFTPENILKMLTLFSFFPICLWSGSLWVSLPFWLWIAFFLKSPAPFREAIRNISSLFPHNQRSL